MMNKWINMLLAAWFFLLPWQTRYIFAPAQLNGAPWEYGGGSLYGTQILLAVSAVLYVIALARGSLPEIKWRRALMALWAGGVAQAALALAQFFTQRVDANKWLGLAAHQSSDLGASVIELLGERWLRAYGSFGSPNSLGVFLAVILTVGALAYLSSARPAEKIFITIGQLIIAAGLFVSFSRGAWLAALGGGALFYALAYRRGYWRAVMRPYFYYLLFFIILAVTLSPFIIARWNFSNRLEAQSMRERLSQTTEWRAVMNRHWFTGTGWGRYTWSLHEIYPDKNGWSVQPVHNIYMLALGEMGALVFVCLLFAAVWFLKYVSRRNVWFMPVVAVLLLAGLFDHWLLSMWTGRALFASVVIFGLIPDILPCVQTVGKAGMGKFDRVATGG